MSTAFNATFYVVIRPILLVGYTFISFKVHQGRANQQNLQFNYGAFIAEVQASALGMMPGFPKLFVIWGHAISWIAFWLCSFSVTFDTPYIFICKTYFKPLDVIHKDYKLYRVEHSFKTMKQELKNKWIKNTIKNHLEH